MLFMLDMLHASTYCLVLLWAVACSVASNVHPDFDRDRKSLVSRSAYEYFFYVYIKHKSNNNSCGNVSCNFLYALICNNIAQSLPVA